MVQSPSSPSPATTSKGKRYIENDLLTVGKLIELNRYIDFIILDRIYRCSFYGSFGYEKITLDINDEVEAVTTKILEKKGDLFPLVLEVINSDQTPEELAREMVVKRYKVLDSENYINTDSYGISELDLIRGIGMDTFILAYGLSTETESYLERLFTHFDFMEKHTKRLDEAGKAMSGLFGNLGFTGSDTFPDPTKMFSSLFGEPDKNKDPLEKEK